VLEVFEQRFVLVPLEPHIQRFGRNVSDVAIMAIIGMFVQSALIGALGATGPCRWPRPCAFKNKWAAKDLLTSGAFEASPPPAAGWPSGTAVQWSWSMVAFPCLRAGLHHARGKQQIACFLTPSTGLKFTGVPSSLAAIF
jgi:hypothetical protein